MPTLKIFHQRDNLLPNRKAYPHCKDVHHHSQKNETLIHELHTL